MARAGLTTERVVQAAAELADEVGFDNLTVSALARRFGVKDASLYSHVRSLRDLRTQVAVLAAREKTDRIADAVAGRAGRDALAAFAHAYREYALEHPGRYAATQSPLDPDAVAISSGHRRAVEISYAVLRGYGLAEPDATDAVRLLRSTLHGYISLETNGGFAHARDPAATWERVIDALHNALQHWPS
ncbi:WHG domain-containing protein [Saccharopolyspora erythraea]|uniref:TetR/AcrR family transcriptional regulator n=1 Tax=Saccharopolyspora erythraea TaxID=1836 RepID=UPI001BA6EA44|nr:TetR/AcrR family transcriptional regulator [Saccharopolyspora erythraea]QUH02924.1 WHG domain-containing protein [Saccharopolyspora erythraea]